MGSPKSEILGRGGATVRSGDILYIQSSQTCVVRDDEAGAEGLIRLRCPKSADTTAVVADFDRCTRFCLAVSATGSARQRAPRHAGLEQVWV